LIFAAGAGYFSFAHSMVQDDAKRGHCSSYLFEKKHFGGVVQSMVQWPVTRVGSMHHKCGRNGRNGRKELAAIGAQLGVLFAGGRELTWNSFIYGNQQQIKKTKCSQGAYC
jgi:hypothetical protein